MGYGYSKTRSIKQNHFENPTHTVRVQKSPFALHYFVMHPKRFIISTQIPIVGHIKLQCSGCVRQNVQVYSKTLPIIEFDDRIGRMFQSATNRIRLIYTPQDPCMVYLQYQHLPTNQPNVGKYTIHGCYGY